MLKHSIISTLFLLSLLFQTQTYAKPNGTNSTELGILGGYTAAITEPLANTPFFGVDGGVWMDSHLKTGVDIVHHLNFSDVSGVSSSITSITGGVDYIVGNSNAMPYLTGGFGLYYGKTKFSGAGATLSSSDLGINGGAGIRFQVADLFDLGAEAVYHLIFADKSTAFVDLAAKAIFNF